MPPFSTGTQLAGAITDLINTALLVPLILFWGNVFPGIGPPLACGCG